MSHEQNLGQKQNKKITNKSFQNVAKFKYLEMALVNQSCMREDIKSRLNCFQNLLPSCLLSKNPKIKIYGTTVLPVVLYGCKTSSLTLREG